MCVNELYRFKIMSSDKCAEFHLLCGIWTPRIDNKAIQCIIPDYIGILLEGIKRESMKVNHAAKIRMVQDLKLVLTSGFIVSYSPVG